MLLSKTCKSGSLNLIVSYLPSWIQSYVPKNKSHHIASSFKLLNSYSRKSCLQTMDDTGSRLHIWRMVGGKGFVCGTCTGGWEGVCVWDMEHLFRASILHKHFRKKQYINLKILFYIRNTTSDWHTLFYCTSHIFPSFFSFFKQIRSLWQTLH